MDLSIQHKDDPCGPARNNTSFKINALEAYHENKPKFGIKYPTWLHGIRSYDLVNGVGYRLHAWCYVRCDEIDVKTLVFK